MTEKKTNSHINHDVLLLNPDYKNACMCTKSL